MSDAGTAIFNHDIVIPNSAYIGSASDTDAIQIDSGGGVVFSSVSGITVPRINGPTIYYVTPSTTDGDFSGEVIVYGTGPGGVNGDIVAGEVYCLDSSAQWEKVDANASATSIGMLGIAIADDTPRFLTRGYYTHATFSFATTGAPLYISETAGDLTMTRPTTSGAYNRVVGYVLDGNNRTIFFNPDNTWVELS